MIYFTEKKKMSDQKITNNDKRLLMFLEDNDVKKDKHIILINENQHGINVQFYDKENGELRGVEFFLPWHRVLKIKKLEVRV